mgnify:CR=1 FL=1
MDGIQIANYADSFWRRMNDMDKRQYKNWSKSLNAVENRSGKRNLTEFWMFATTLVFFQLYILPIFFICKIYLLNIKNQQNFIL